MWWEPLPPGPAILLHSPRGNLLDSDQSPPLLPWHLPSWPPPGSLHRSLPSLLPPGSQGFLPRSLLGSFPPGRTRLGTSPLPLAGQELGSAGHSVEGFWAEAGAAWWRGQRRKLAGRAPQGPQKKAGRPSQHSFVQSPSPRESSPLPLPAFLEQMGIGQWTGQRGARRAIVSRGVRASREAMDV